MDTKQFKKILKESLSSGASSLFEEEEEEEEEETDQESEQDNNSELVDYAQELLPYLEKTKQEIDSLESELKINPENFARAFAYYYVSLYYNNDSKWKYTIATPSRYKTLINILLDKVKTNIVCEYVNVIKLSKKEKMFENPTNFLKELQSDAPGKEVFLAIATVLNKIHGGSYDLNSSNSKKLQTLIDKVGNFDPKKCKSMESPSKTGAPEEKTSAPEEEEQSIRTKKQQPMSLESLKATIKKTDARDYATKIITALKQDMKDLRVKVNEAREKTPLLTNTIKALQSIPDKEIQKAALKSILDFFKVNKLQIDDKTKSDLIKSDILVIQKKAKQKKQQPGEEKQGEKEASEQENEEDEDEESGLTRALDKFQSGLDIAGAAGMIPVLAPIATPASIASLILNLSRGKFGWALFDLITLVPVVGGAAKAGKLGNAARTAANMAKWKGGRALIKTLGSAKAAKKGIDSAKATKAAIEAAQGARGAAELIGDMIPHDLWNQIENAEIPEVIRKNLDEEDKDKPLIDFVLDTLGELGLFNDQIEGLRDAWSAAKNAANPKRETPEEGGAGYNFMRENLNLNEKRYDMLLERFNIK